MICKGKGSIILVINNRLVENILFNSGFDSLHYWEEVEGHCRVLESLGRGRRGRRGRQG